MNATFNDGEVKHCSTGLFRRIYLNINTFNSTYLYTWDIRYTTRKNDCSWCHKNYPTNAIQLTTHAWSKSLIRLQKEPHHTMGSANCIFVRASLMAGSATTALMHKYFNSRDSRCAQKKIHTATKPPRAQMNCNRINKRDKSFAARLKPLSLVSRCALRQRAAANA